MLTENPFEYDKYVTSQGESPSAFWIARAFPEPLEDGSLFHFQLANKFHPEINMTLGFPDEASMLAWRDALTQIDGLYSSFFGAPDPAV